MNPINAINQEFARVIVEEWSDEAAIHCQEQEANEHSGIGASVRALVVWVLGRIVRREGLGEILPLSETTNQ